MGLDLCFKIRNGKLKGHVPSMRNGCRMTKLEARAQQIVLGLVNRLIAPSAESQFRDGPDGYRHNRAGFCQRAASGGGPHFWLQPRHPLR